ncbi:MAG: DUF2029 domain-containing protein [Clostridia bacterium]|nr:DUF2029 domain-containing protein [Clostridia bacterium]
MSQRIRSWLCAARDRALGMLKRRDPVEYFIALMLLAISGFALACLIGGADTFMGLFFLGGEDLFMDFFHSICDAAKGAAVYTERKVIYPPLANLILLLLSRTVPEAYLNVPPNELRHSWNAYPAAILTYVYFFLFALLVLMLLIHREEHPQSKRSLLTFTLILSFPVVFLLERANLVILSTIALLIFTQNYDSESRAKRELGLVMLAVAAALKLYPALFGVVLLRDRRWRELGRAVLYTLLLLLLPSFFFGGPQCLWLVLQNTFAYSAYAGQNANGFFAQIGLPEWTGRALLFAGYTIEVVFLVLSTLLQRKNWVVWALSSAILMTVPSIFGAHNWILFLPALLAFLRTEKQLKGLNWLCFFLLSIPFYMFIPKPYQDNTMIVFISLTIAVTLFLTLRLFADWRKARNATQAEGDHGNLV